MGRFGLILDLVSGKDLRRVLLREPEMVQGRGRGRMSA